MEANTERPTIPVSSIVFTVLSGLALTLIVFSEGMDAAMNLMRSAILVTITGLLFGAVLYVFRKPLKPLFDGAHTQVTKHLPFAAGVLFGKGENNDQ